MYTMTKRKRVSDNLRRLALVAAVAGVTGAVAVPAFAQDSVTTTQTTTTYDNGYTTYRSGPTYYESGYAYPPPAYTYVDPVPPPPVVGVGISVPFVHLGVGF